MTKAAQLSLVIVCFLFFPISLLATSPAEKYSFFNPLLVEQRSDLSACEPENINPQRFTVNLDVNHRTKICQAVQEVVERLVQNEWSPDLSEELKSVWQTFITNRIVFTELSEKSPKNQFALAEPIAAPGASVPTKVIVHLRISKLAEHSFFLILLHELKHVADYYQFSSPSNGNSYEMERRAFLLMSRLMEESPRHNKLRDIPRLWISSWKNLPLEQIAKKRDRAIYNFLGRSESYHQFFTNQKYSEAVANTANPARYINQTPERKTFLSVDDRLPNRPLLLKDQDPGRKLKRTALNFALEKPSDSYNPKAILKAAAENEKKLFYGFSDYIYEQQIDFSCHDKNKVFAKISERQTIARNATESLLTPENTNSRSLFEKRCKVGLSDLTSDFTESFWACPGLERLPVNFVAFDEIDGEKVARYTITQPQKEVFSQLAAQYPQIKPFRIFIGTIFVSVESGQIIKFWGTSYPNDKITGRDSQKVIGSYLVTAIREKYAISGGLWLTTFIGASALIDRGKQSIPFTYTVTLNNYRQTLTDVKILDNESVLPSNPELRTAFSTPSGN